MLPRLTIPLHESQWPRAVVRTEHDQFYVDTCAAFGATPSSGVYSHITDAGAEILRSQGIGPLDKWVDDHIFLWIRHTFIADYNIIRANCAKCIPKFSSMKQSGSRLWFAGANTLDGLMEEFNENCSFPIQDLSCQSDCSQHDALFLYSLCDIDHASELLGIPWEASEDQLFAPMTIYIGFTWDLDSHTFSCTRQGS